MARFSLSQSQCILKAVVLSLRKESHCSYCLAFWGFVIVLARKIGYLMERALRFSERRQRRVRFIYNELALKQLRVFCIRVATVMGPTPPGTGVIKLAISLTVA